MREILEDNEKKFLAYSVDARSNYDALEQLAGLLTEKGYVKDTFSAAILKREKAYPTGLPTGEIGVAIPHADPKHVNRPAVCLGVLKKPVNFIVMGSETDEVSVSILFMLAIKHKEDHMTLLTKLIDICQNQETLNSLLSKDEETIQRVLESLYD